MGDFAQPRLGAIAGRCRLNLASVDRPLYPNDLSAPPRQLARRPPPSRSLLQGFQVPSRELLPLPPTDARLMAPRLCGQRSQHLVRGELIVRYCDRARAQTSSSTGTLRHKWGWVGRSRNMSTKRPRASCEQTPSCWPSP